MRKFIITLLTLVVFYTVSCMEAEKDSLTIKASINNVSEFEKFVDEETFLQLVKMGENGLLAFETDEKGRTLYKSNYVKIPFPNNNKITLHAKNLEPGKYVIAVQFLKDRNVYPLLIKNDKNLIIKIPEDINILRRIDLGSVSFGVR